MTSSNISKPATDAPAVVTRLMGHFPDEIQRWDNAHGQLAVTVRKDRLLDMLRLLKEAPENLFDHLADLTAIDFLKHPVESERFVVVYNLYSHERHCRLRLRALVPERDAAVDSVVDLWKSADWPEREVYDMFGITFNNHPDLRRLLMPDDYQGHPLCKDYPLKGRGERESFEVVK